MATKMDFSAVSAAVKASDPEAAEQKRARAARKVEKRFALLALLTVGETPARVTSKGKEQKARKLNAGATVAVVVKALRAGCLLAEVRDAAPDLAHRFPWKLAGDAIRTVAEQAQMAESLPPLFGLPTAQDLAEEVELAALEAETAPAPAAEPAPTPVAEKAARVESDHAQNRAARKAHGRKAA